MVLDKGRTVTDTCVSNVDFEEVKCGRIRPFLYSSGEDSQSFSSSQLIFCTTLVGATVIPGDENTFSLVGNMS